MRGQETEKEKMMELEEMLKKHEVETLEQLESKLAEDAARKEREALTEKYEKEKANLEAQVKNLESIKDKQGNNLGDVKKELDDLKEKLQKIEVMNKGEQPENATPTNSVKTEEDWRRENEAREKALADDDWNKLDEAFSAMDAEAKKLVSTEEGRAAFIDNVIGSKAVSQQETFRRPVQKEKPSVQEQVALALKTARGEVPAHVQPSGSGFSAERKPIPKPAQRPRVLVNSGGIMDRINATKGE